MFARIDGIPMNTDHVVSMYPTQTKPEKPDEKVYFRIRILTTSAYLHGRRHFDSEAECWEAVAAEYNMLRAKLSGQAEELIPREPVDDPPSGNNGDGSVNLDDYDTDGNPKTGGPANPDPDAPQVE